MKDDSTKRFSVILLGSAALHLAVLGAIFGAWAFNVALKFGSISFESGGDSQYKVAMLDRTKPLYLPKGFYAIEKPPEEVKKREDRPTTDDKTKAAKDDEKKAEKDEKTDEDAQKPEKPDEPKPVVTGKFGSIKNGALKPHLTNIYRAYEEGRISVDAFTVTVACKAEPDGSLTNIRLVKSSGEKLIDDTAINIVKELSAMHALGPLANLSSLSITLQKTPTAATLTAVGFADDPDVTQDFANQLSALKFAARFKMENADQMTLLDNVQIASSGNRVSVSLGLPNSTAGAMMQHSFGSQAQAKSGA